MDYINNMTIKGRIGEAPTMRFMPSGDAVINFSVATKHGQHVEWHPIVGYKDAAERANKEFGKGDVVFIQGEIRTREMQTADEKAAGRKPRKIRELIASSMHLVEKNKKAATPDESPASDTDYLPAEHLPAEPGNDGIPSFI